MRFKVAAYSATNNAREVISFKDGASPFAIERIIAAVARVRFQLRAIRNPLIAIFSPASFAPTFN